MAQKHSGNIKRTVRADPKIWEDLKDYYTLNGSNISECIRRLMEVHHRQLTEAGKFAPQIDPAELIESPNND